MEGPGEQWLDDVLGRGAGGEPLSGEEGQMSEEYQRIRVLVETAERSFKGYVYKPLKDDGFRLSDHLNTYGKEFICLTDVEVADRGQHYRVGEKREFVAISVAAITYLTPLEPDK